MIFFSPFKKAINKGLSERIERWLKRRVPSRFQHKLSNRNIFIMPTRFGFMYLLFDVLLFLLGTNYQKQYYFVVKLFIGESFYYGNDA